jgi:hypothetical protein
MHNPVVTGKAWRYAFRLFLSGNSGMEKPSVPGGFGTSFCLAAKKTILGNLVNMGIFIYTFTIFQAWSACREVL